MVDIEQLVKQAGIQLEDSFESGSKYAVGDDEVRALARVVAEMCAKTAEQGEWKLTKTGRGIAAAIRSLFAD